MKVARKPGCLKNVLRNILHKKTRLPYRHSQSMQKTHFCLFHACRLGSALSVQLLGFAVSVQFLWPSSFCPCYLRSALSVLRLLSCRLRPAPLFSSFCPVPVPQLLSSLLFPFCFPRPVLRRQSEPVDLRDDVHRILRRFPGTTPRSARRGRACRRVSVRPPAASCRLSARCLRRSGLRMPCRCGP